MEAPSNTKSAYTHLCTVAITVCLSCILCHMCGAQTTVYSYSEKIAVCHNTYGTQIGQLEGIPSLLTCAVVCMRNAQCESLLYDTATNSCILNSDDWLCPNTTSANCPETGLVYTNIQRSPNSLCLGTNICTESMGGMRLCEGGGAGACDPAQGRVEVWDSNSGQWSTVCDDLWEYNAGKVVCSAFGYTTSTLIANASCIYGSAATPIGMDNVICDGTESSLFSCSYLPAGSDNCGHWEDVVLHCS